MTSASYSLHPWKCKILMHCTRTGTILGELERNDFTDASKKEKQQLRSKTSILPDTENRLRNCVCLSPCTCPLLWRSCEGGRSPVTTGMISHRLRKGGTAVNNDNNIFITSIHIDNSNSSRNHEARELIYSPGLSAIGLWWNISKNKCQPDKIETLGKKESRNRVIDKRKVDRVSGILHILEFCTTGR